MSSNTFRPWGELKWVMSKLHTNKWDIIGSLSTEIRCLTTIKNIYSLNLSNSNFFIEIIDPINSSDHDLKRKDNKSQASILDANFTSNIITRELMQEDSKIYSDITTLLAKCGSHVVIDISCLPKRFFFPLVKLALKESKISNLIITYTKPEQYCSDDLSDEPEPWYPLPLFRPTSFPEKKYDIAFVGTGFMPFSLPKLLKDNHSEISLRLLFPFPPGPPNYQRSWEFVRKIEKHYNFKDEDKIIRVNAMDVSEAFSHIYSATSFGSFSALFAPYGPKPISLAICLYASLFDCPVYYTQPKYYSPDYSVGSKECYAYCIKLKGNNLFAP